MNTMFFWFVEIVENVAVEIDTLSRKNKILKYYYEKKNYNSNRNRGFV